MLQDWQKRPFASYLESAQARYTKNMSSSVGLLVLVGLLTLLGSSTLLFVTVKYYWGERGTPPPTGEQRRIQKEKELALRKKQIEHAQQSPVTSRSPDFLDNRKR
jgi:hypothetical protein